MFAHVAQTSRAKREPTPRARLLQRLEPTLDDVSRLREGRLSRSRQGVRERGDDVVQIAEKFLVRFSKEEGKAFKRLGAEATELFRSMRWPGNVRQLQNVIRNIVVLNDGEEDGPHRLPQGLRESEAIAAPPRVYENATAPVTLNGAMNGHAGETSNGHLNGQASLVTRVAPLVGETLAYVERTFIEATIDEFEGSIPRAARALDLSPSTLYRKREAWSKKEA